MTYEIPIPHSEVLKEKPIEATKLMEYIEREGFRPIAITVDNNLGKVFVYFDKPLTAAESRELMRVVNEFYKKHLEGVE